MIDFTDAKRTHKGYDGVNGNKIQIEYNNEKYMLKCLQKERVLDGRLQ